MIAALPMMKPLTSPSVQAPDVIGSTARKRRREILQSNRASKTSNTGENIPNPTMDSKKKMRTGTAGIERVQHRPNTNSPSSTPLDTFEKEDVASNSSCYISSTKLNPIPTLTALSSTTNSKMPYHCGSLPECLPTKVVPVKPPIKMKSTKIKQAAKAAVPQCPKSPQSLDTNSKKKPQMRYDPSVPMTKEAAAVWRREQRRKRNRDSAAASRQRQRNRITELEDEVSEWKKKYDDAMLQISKQEAELKRNTLPGDDQKSSTSDSISELMPQFIPKSPTGGRDIGLISCYTVKPAMVYENESYTAVSPCLTPTPTPHSSNVPSDFVSLSLSQALSIVRDTEESEVHHRIKQEEKEEQEQTLGMNEVKKEENLIEISRPAVKITGTLPSLTSSTLCNSPDSSVIPTRSSVELSPSTSSIDVPLVSDALPSLSLSVITEEIPDGTANKDATNEDYVLDIMDFPTDANDMELGNFLLDAADWL